ncbi:hypothetical protein FE782_24705 [Paenibacillus antri]|uniref:Uncharacterized protein n=1 Tax=Paenibacillus antri TaxID=2582848 RepID=A0A5R9G1C6_9BACL|nr:hypothetical protein [Paenibacillus antri]TLS49591.1 hypothetical protein FE782_24705 [Paenibacillus antri]
MKRWFGKRSLAASLSAALLFGGAAAWPDTSSADDAAPRTTTREVVFDIDRGSVLVNSRAPKRSGLRRNTIRRATTRFSGTTKLAFTYRLKIESPGKAAFVLVPLRGLYMGAVKFDGDVVKTDALHVGEVYAIGRTNGTEPSVELELGAASGSFMPFVVLVVPLP